jgi:hypothetical protein
MENDFEQLWNDKLEGAPLKDLVPGFDREAEWNKLSEKLRPSRKRPVWLVWSHAAAIILGILITWFLMKESGGNKQEPNLQVVNAPAPVKPEDSTLGLPLPYPAQKPDIKNATALQNPAMQNINNPKNIIVGKTQKIKKTQQDILKEAQHNTPDNNEVAKQNNTKEINPAPLPDSNDNKTQHPPHPIAIVKKTRQQAIHLLDIDNEDRKYMFNESPEIHSKDFLNQMFNLLSSPDAVATTTQPILLRSILRKQ